MPELDTGLEKPIPAGLNERAGGCAGRLPVRAEEVRARPKGRGKEHGPSGRVRVSKSGCPEPCARGTTVVVLPGFCWYGGVTLKDVDRIITEHMGGMVTTPGSDIKERP